MAALYVGSRPDQAHGRSKHRLVVDEIPGLVRVYKDGQVERFPIIPSLPCTAIPSDLKVVSRDIIISDATKMWARVYVPTSGSHVRLPLVVYFHGGGFCVGSAAWSCYHDFLATLASKANCVILSIEYHLAPESRLPRAYEDGFRSLTWLSQLALKGSDPNSWWLSRCNFTSLFLAGDSAGANIAHNVAIRLAMANVKPLCHKGTILIQPFFGGEARVRSELGPQPASSALSLAASDAYWRLALPVGSNRDHPWCNPLSSGGMRSLAGIELPTTMVCISEMDILKDRNLEFCSTMARAEKAVQKTVYGGVGHAFQILDKSPFSSSRVKEMMAHLKGFISS